MSESAFLLGLQLDNHKIQYILHKPQWDKFQYPDIDLDFSNWTSIKYLNEGATDFNDDIESIPNDRGGLYLFYIKCPIIGGMTEYPLYIGRAQITNGQNLRKRVKEYYQKYSRDDERPKIYRMLAMWGNDLHLAFYPFDNNSTIVNIERDIINSLLLPMNDLIPDKDTKAAVKAFQL